MASGYQRLLSWLGSGDSLQPEAPPVRRRVAGQAPALSPQSHLDSAPGVSGSPWFSFTRSMPCDVRGAITGGLARIAHVIARCAETHGALPQAGKMMRGGS